MSDFLLELSKNPNARKIVKNLGLPIPMPQNLRRAKGARKARPLQDQDLVFVADGVSALTGVLARALTAAGANPYLVGDDDLLAQFKDPGEAHGRPAMMLDLSSIKNRLRPHSLVFDASEVRDPGDLRRLYDFFHPLVRKLNRCGRVVVLGRPPAAMGDAEAAAAQSSLEGFTRSVGKEIGKKGSTANLIYVHEGAEQRVAGVVRFLLSARSAFVSGQPFYVSELAQDAGDPVWAQPLEHKVALVTGAARGIGKATAALLAAEGAHVFCLDRPEDDSLVSKVARQIEGTPLLVDISAQDAARTIIEAVQKRGGLDIVVHNAGITRDKTLAWMKEEQWDLTIDVNLSAVARITSALLEGGLNDGGRIICLSSVAGIAGNLGQTNYAASKSGLIGYVRHLCGALAARGITINAVAPGFIETRMTAAVPLAIREGGRRLSSLGQGGQPRDVGELITFLSTPGAAGLTGNVIRACGGALIGA